MPVFDIHCAQVDDKVRIDFGGDEARGDAAFRGFSCEHESACEAGGIRCALFDAGGVPPFEPADAFEFFNS